MQGPKYIHLESMALGAAEKTGEQNAGSESEFKAAHLGPACTPAKRKGN